MIQVQKFFLYIFCFLLLIDVVLADQNVSTLYIHGYTGNPEDVQKQKEAFSTPEKYQAPALPDTQKEVGVGINRFIASVARVWKKNLNISQAFMGQGADLKVIASSVEQNFVDESFVLFGICRGGSAAINYIAQYNPENLKALIIEATPASMPALLHAKMAKIGLSCKHDEKFFRFFFQAYPKNSIPPVQAVKNILNKELPILILHSKDDCNIPFEHALMLYLSFKEHGFNNVFLVPLHGKHAYSLQEDSLNYLTAVHSFYKNFGLAYNEKYATVAMNSYQYDLVKAQEKVALYEKKLQQQLQKTHKKMALGAGLAGASIYAWNHLIEKNKRSAIG
ncbi:hypothetical protein KBB68_01560 [Candidatus Babeliales bacterium]|nr:hypothetical protein [Candidatus Babeliales bacterium]